MPEFLMNNLGTIVVAAILLIVLALVAKKMISDRKQGKSSCGCGCGDCPNSALCHPEHKKNAGR